MTFKRLRDIVEKVINMGPDSAPIHSDITVHHLKNLAKNAKPTNGRYASRNMFRFTIDSNNKIHAGDAHDNFHSNIARYSGVDYRDDRQEGYIHHEPKTDTYHYGSFEGVTSNHTPEDHPMLQRFEKAGIKRSRMSRFEWDT